jgi:hypothetical protein
MEPILRMVVETDSNGQAEEIFLVQLDEEAEPHNPWSIPFQRTTISLNEFRKEGVEIAPPTVGDQPPATDADNEDEAEEDQKAK